jgi:hypothetical protein
MGRTLVRSIGNTHRNAISQISGRMMGIASGSDQGPIPMLNPSYGCVKYRMSGGFWPFFTGIR